MRWLIASAVILAVSAVCAGGYVYSQHRCLCAVGDNDDDVVVTVTRGQSFGTVRDTVADAGLLRCPDAWYWYARYKGLDRQLKAGEFLLNRQLSGYDILDRLIEGKAVEYSVTLIEGWTAAQAIAAIQAHDAVETTLPADAAANDWLIAIGADEDHLEGLLFPNTYRFERGTSDVEVVGRAYRLMRKELADAWQQRADDLPLESPYEALTLASIIEKETARDDEREAIAGVFVRRLRKGMRLQTDPTVIYGLGNRYDGNIRRRDLVTDTPYNTYTRKGLTPTPIALSGRASLRAAVTPADGDALFFVATGLPDGSHTFSATEQEHNAAVAVYLQRLRARDQ
ncbi:MAG: endolytic transglycosylase MltG [Pseudomonadota bacterium]